MKAPRQWITTWPKEDPKRLDLANCLCMLPQAQIKGDTPFNNTVWNMSRPELTGLKEIDSVDCFMAFYLSRT